jgi:hypothetical protein
MADQPKPGQPARPSGGPAKGAGDARRDTGAVRRGGAGEPASPNDLLARAEAMLSEGSLDETSGAPGGAKGPSKIVRRAPPSRRAPEAAGGDPSSPFDIKQVIEGGTRKASLEQLAQEGHKHVRVINESKINELILAAVLRVIEERSKDVKLTEAESAARTELTAIDAEIEKIRAMLADENLPAAEKERLLERLAELQRNRAIQKQVVDRQTQKIVTASREEFQKLLAKEKEEAEQMAALNQKAKLVEARNADLEAEVKTLRDEKSRAAAQAEMVSAADVKALREAREQAEGDARQARGQVEKVRELWEAAKKEHGRETETLRAEVERARAEAASSRAGGQAFREDLDKVKEAAAQARADGEKHRTEAERFRAEAEVLKTERARQEADAEALRAAVARHQADLSAERTSAASQAKTDSEKQRAEAERFRAEAEVLRAAQARQEADAEALRTALARHQADLSAERTSAATLRTDADRLRTEAEQFKVEYEKAAAKLEMQGGQMAALTKENQDLRENAPGKAAQEADAVRLMEQLQAALAAQGEGVSSGLKNQLTTMQGALKEEIQRQIAVSTASAKSGGKMVDITTFLDGLFRDDMQMETNLTNVKERKSTGGKSGKVSDSLKRLKQMQGGGGEAPKK